MKRHQTLQGVPIDKIIVSDQPRKIFAREAIHLLAEDIKRNGIIEPIIVWADSTKFYLISGERRLRAAQHAGLSIIDALVTRGDDLGDSKLDIQLAENLLRETLTPEETAEAFRTIKEREGLSVRELAKRYNIKPTTMHRKLAGPYQNGTSTQPKKPSSKPPKISSIKTFSDGTIKFILTLQPADSTDATATTIYSELSKLLAHLKLEWQALEAARQRTITQDGKE
jgi:ParB/RepB/Spo0J family partition protein